jgi:AraC-like DNA-binding protein
MNPKQQGLSVMLTNALRSNSPLRFERNAPLAKRHQAVILPIGGHADVSGRIALDANHVGVRKVQLAAPHPLVAITPADKFRRRMVRSAGMTAEIVQETASERTEYRFKAPVHLLILFERGVRREGDTDVARALLAKPAPSVTKIGLMVGYNETSSFTAAFRKATGLTPTAYHRGFA